MTKQKHDDARGASLSDAGLGACACMGSQGGDPHCPCEMQRRGLKPTWTEWTQEDKDRFFSDLERVFGWKVPND